MKRDKYRGVLLGAGIGDALGAPVEFMRLEDILKVHGPDGVTTLLPWGGHPAGSYTDDTQMTIATATGALEAHREEDFQDSDAAAPYVWNAYRDWLYTQEDPQERRAPGTTCLTALGGNRMGTPEDEPPLNDSKGCGTIMRIAPCALLYPDSPFEWAWVCGAMTHGHETGQLAGAAFAEILHRVLEGESLQGAVTATIRHLIDLTPQGEGVRAVLQKALDRYDEDIPLPIRIVETGTRGEGWVAEETLGIAIACALEHPTSFKDAVLAAVNITGDSDSTGSVTGALMGALLGAQAIPEDWRAQVENAELLTRLADELYRAHMTTPARAAGE